MTLRAFGSRAAAAAAAAGVPALLAACGMSPAGSGSSAHGGLPKEPVLLSYLTWVGKAQVDLIQQAVQEARQ